MQYISDIKTIVFDWGDTIMRDYGLPGPMSGWSKVAWINGAEASVKTLSTKYICVIATSADHSDTQEMKKALARVGADKYFHHFYSQKELGYKKPDFRFFQSVMHLSGAQPESAAMVGNLYEKDIVGAKKAGMLTIFYNENKLEGAFPAADFTIYSMGQLLDIFTI